MMGMRLKHAVPILRMMDEAKTREFYLDFLGFSIDFSHRFRRQRAALHADHEERLHHSPFGTLR
jgi:hypothetical protein